MASTGLLTSILIFCAVLFGIGFLGWLVYVIIDNAKSRRFDVHAQVVGKLYEPPMRQAIKEWRGLNAPAITPIQFPESHQLILAFDDGRRGLLVDRTTYERFKAGDNIVLTYEQSFLSKTVNLVRLSLADGSESDTDGD
jgi:hypothetical protein